jgi:hypothetical protein
VALRLILVLAFASYAANAGAPRASGQRSDFVTLPSEEPITPIPVAGPTDPLKKPRSASTCSRIRAYLAGMRVAA